MLDSLQNIISIFCLKTGIYRILSKVYVSQSLIVSESDTQFLLFVIYIQYCYRRSQQGFL